MTITVSDYTPLLSYNYDLDFIYSGSTTDVMPTVMAGLSSVYIIEEGWHSDSSDCTDTYFIEGPSPYIESSSLLRIEGPYSHIYGTIEDKKIRKIKKSRSIDISNRHAMIGAMYFMKGKCIHRVSPKVHKKRVKVHRIVGPTN